MQSWDWLRNLRILRMRNAVSRLCKFSDCTEHIYHIVGNFYWCKILQKCVHTPQNKCSRFFWQNECAILWPQPYQLMAMPHMRTEKISWRTIKQRSILVQQRASLPYVWRPTQLWNYQDCFDRWETRLEQYQHCLSWHWHLQGVSQVFGNFAQ